MGTGQIAAARLKNGGMLNLDKFTQVGLINTMSGGVLAHDVKSAGAALSTGMAIEPGKVGLDTEGEVSYLLKWAMDRDLTTGLITTGSLAGSEVAPWVGRGAMTSDPYAQAKALVNNSPDLLIGGGSKYFSEQSDGENLHTAFRQKGYKVYKEIKKKPSKMKGDKMVVLASGTSMPPASKRGNFFSAAWQTAQHHFPMMQGYFLIMTQPHVEWACVNKDIDYLTSEMLDFDKTVGEIMEYAGMMQNTLVIVVGDREVGGLTVMDNGKGKPTYKWASTGSTANMVPVYAYGVGAEVFSGQYQNIELFNKITSLVD